MTGCGWPAVAALPGWPLDVEAVMAAVESARSAAGSLSGPRGVRDRTGRVAAAASIRAARASAALEGVPLALDHDGGSVSNPVLAGAIRVTAGLSSLVGTWRRAPLQALARMHMLAAADLVATDRLGRPGADRAGDLTSRLAALAELITRGTWPAPVMVAVVHGELAALAPFGSADGVVARAAARLTMITTGLDPSGLCLPEVVHLRSVPDYRAGLGAYAHSGRAGVEAWVVQECRALSQGATQARALAVASGP